MSQSVVIQGTTYSLPSQSDNPPWGDSLSTILLALIDIANTTSNASDILTTTLPILNNETSPLNITGMFFDPSQIRSAIVSYSVHRSTSTSEVSECGQLYLTLSSTAGSWELARYSAGISGVTFSILPSGQIQYVSDNTTGSNYAGTIQFNAKTFSQT